MGEWNSNRQGMSDAIACFNCSGFKTFYTGVKNVSCVCVVWKAALRKLPGGHEEDRGCL